MRHPEIDTLVQMATGTADRATRRHLESCAGCRDDVQIVIRGRAAGRLLSVEPQLAELAPPPEDVWERIQEELADEQDVASERVTQSERDRRGWLPVAAAAVIGLVAGVGATWVATRPGSNASGTTVTASSSPISPLGGHLTRGTITRTGPVAHPSLSVHLAHADPGKGFIEVWLLDPDSGGMVALGVMNQDNGTYAVPGGLDLSAYRQVDVSREPFDGNPQHSKTSLARGDLP